MSTQDQRLKKIEQRVILDEENKDPLFVEWGINLWMPEEKADVLAKHPGCDYFFKHMLPYNEPYRAEQRDQPILRTLNGTMYGARKLTPEQRKRHLKQDRTLSPADEEWREKQIQRLRDYMNEAKGLPPRPDKEIEPPQFETLENPWTDEEKADVLAKHPECDWFKKTGVPGGPLYGKSGTGKPVLRTLDGSPYEAEKKVPWVTYSLTDIKRFQQE